MDTSTRRQIYKEFHKYKNQHMDIAQCKKQLSFNSSCNKVPLDRPTEADRVYEPTKMKYTQIPPQ